MGEDELTELIYAAKNSLGDIDENPIFRSFYLESPHSRPAIHEKIEQLSVLFSDADGSDGEIRKIVQASLDGHEVLYFPTYRRIETELPDMDSRSRQKRTVTWRYADAYAGDRESKSLINFGLKDVEYRLRSITDDIRKGTFEAYARISGKTLDQLLLGGESTQKDDATYDISAIKVVLGRIGKSDSQTERRIIELVASGEISNRKHDYLRYFLSQMIEVYKEKQDQESAVEAFAKVVSSYWSGSESEKVFEFEKVSAEASVRNTITNTTLQLSALSSGEKQIISTFARLYLELEKKYLVLIDEPELSLSMEWQRKFLPDILASTSCAQLIAITHSPFIFENDLDPYASSLKVSYKKSVSIES
jgi:ABC-type molybdenum transport system ATPase subunit/photorepair protein PhrA